MKSPAIVERHPALRWMVPLGVACLAGVAITGVIRARESAGELPETDPAALVSAVEHSRDASFSGTFVSELSLGLPALAALPAVSRPKAQTSFTSLFDGSHTMQLWYGGRDRQRIALLGGPGDETDLFRNGRQVWQWNSADRVAVHTRLADRDDAAFGHEPAEALTPAGLASSALAALDPDTGLSVDDDVTVADRRAYELVLTPHDDATKIGSVRVAIDGATKVPLGVQVYPKGSSSAAIDVAFTSIRFGMPAERNFEFAPPPNARVSEASGAPRDPSAAIAEVWASGWTTVYQLPGQGPKVRHVRAVADGFDAVSPVSGHWGAGRLVESPLLSILVTNDGRMYAGAVRPARLYSVAAAGAPRPARRN